MEPPNDIFDISPRRSVNEATFLIKVRNSKLLDYEKFKSLNLTIVAKEISADGKWRFVKYFTNFYDQSFKYLIAIFSTAPLTINILDRNDQIPEFTKKSYEVFIPENVGVGVTIAKVQAFDTDSGKFGTRGIRYTSISGGIADLFNLDSVAGKISVKSAGGNFFDRELFAQHYLTVEARDDLGQGNRNSVPLIINIEDLNDNYPIFLQNKYETRLLENKKSFETVLRVEARDADLNGTKNSEVFYEIVDGEFKDNFTIDANTGVIQPKASIDFERLSRSNSNIRPIYLSVRKHITLSIYKCNKHEIF